MNRESILEELLKEALDKIDYVLDTPPDCMWESKVTDFQASTYMYLSTGKVSDSIYPHEFLNRGE